MHACMYTDRHRHAQTHGRTYLSTETSREDKDVFRFQVPVDYVVLVEVSQPASNLCSKGMLECHGEGLQVLALKGAKRSILQDKEGLWAEAHAHQVNDVGVAEPTEDGHLLAYQLVGGYAIHFCCFQ